MSARIWHKYMEKDTFYKFEAKKRKNLVSKEFGKAEYIKALADIINNRLNNIKQNAHNIEEAESYCPLLQSGTRMLFDTFIRTCASRRRAALYDAYQKHQDKWAKQRAIKFNDPNFHPRTRDYFTFVPDQTVEQELQQVKHLLKNWEPNSIRQSNMPILTPEERFHEMSSTLGHYKYVECIFCELWRQLFKKHGKIELLPADEERGQDAIMVCCKDIDIIEIADSIEPYRKCLRIPKWLRPHIIDPKESEQLHKQLQSRLFNKWVIDHAKPTIH